MQTVNTMTEEKIDKKDVVTSIQHFSGQMSLKQQHSIGGGQSADSLDEISKSPKNGSITSLNSDGSTKKSVKFDKFTSFKNSHSHSTGQLNLNIFGDVQLNDSQFFEVMYIGKIKVSHKKVPKTFIDDAIPKFIAHDKNKIKNMEMVAKRDLGQRQNLTDSSVVQNDMTIVMSKEIDSGSDTSTTTDLKTTENKLTRELSRNDSIQAGITKRTRSASFGAIEQNRTMVFILGRSDIRLISPDRKQILLHKIFTDLVNIVQGTNNTDHFGIVCSETKDNKTEFIGYVFKCQSGSIAHDIITSVSKSLETLEELKKETDHDESTPYHFNELLTCEHCPMVWFKKLTHAIDGCNEKKAYNTIMKFIEELNDNDQEIIIQKIYAMEKLNDFSLSERNKFLMSLIESHCQMRQQRHIHDSVQNRAEFLNQYLGGSVFMKAKRSLTSSFDHLLKRRTSKDFVDGNNNFHSEHIDDYRKTNPLRSMSLAPNAPQTMTYKEDSPQRQQINTSKMDMFRKVGNSPRDGAEKASTWRQNMLQHVSVPKNNEHAIENDSLKFLPSKKHKIPSAKRGPEELRDLWKFAGKQIIVLLRMEKENARLQERQNEHEIRRIKLDYDEILPCDEELHEVWENYISEASRTLHTDNKIFLQAIKSGVPKAKRGDVWLLLADQFNKNHPPLDLTDFPDYQTPYQDLLRNLTEHQHSIFIDIGRTFPNHEFFRTPFGLGQLSLFNILKAYSILDPAVGYCQGLAFITGILLLHLNEAEAYRLLRHLMFRREFRNNFLPDMAQFQLQLYQLSRLIKDSLPDVYELFDANDVTVTLYASSWMLTIFSSSFELGFVTKVFDLLFFASNEVIFRVILSLLLVHRNELLKLHSFEDIMEYLKNVIPKIDEPTMRTVFKNVYALNISRQLMDYKIEYNVLKEEIRNTNEHIENLNRAKDENRSMQKQLRIAESNIERLENIRHNNQQEIQSMQMQVRSLENTIETMADFLTSLSTRPNFDMPADIRRLLNQYEQNQRQQQLKRRPLFSDRKIGKSMSVNSSMGMGMNLKVLVEQNESEQMLQTPPCAVTPDIPSPSNLSSSFDESIQANPSTTLPSDIGTKKKYFDKAYERIRQEQAQGANAKLFRQSPVEKPQLVEQATLHSEDEDDLMMATSPSEHPLTCDDIHFQFIPMELRTIKPTNNLKKKP